MQGTAGCRTCLASSRELSLTLVASDRLLCDWINGWHSVLGPGVGLGPASLWRGTLPARRASGRGPARMGVGRLFKRREMLMTGWTWLRVVVEFKPLALRVLRERKQEL